MDICGRCCMHCSCCRCRIHCACCTLLDCLGLHFKPGSQDSGNAEHGSKKKIDNFRWFLEMVEKCKKWRFSNIIMHRRKRLKIWNPPMWAKSYTNTHKWSKMVSKTLFWPFFEAFEFSSKKGSKTINIGKSEFFGKSSPVAGPRHCNCSMWSWRSGWHGLLYGACVTNY